MTISPLRSKNLISFPSRTASRKACCGPIFCQYRQNLSPPMFQVPLSYGAASGRFRRAVVPSGLMRIRKGPPVAAGRQRLVGEQPGERGAVFANAAGRFNRRVGADVMKPARVEHEPQQPADLSEARAAARVVRSAVDNDEVVGRPYKGELAARPRRGTCPAAI